MILYLFEESCQIPVFVVPHRHFEEGIGLFRAKWRVEYYDIKTLPPSYRTEHITLPDLYSGAQRKRFHIIFSIPYGIRIYVSQYDLLPEN